MCSRQLNFGDLAWSTLIVIQTGDPDQLRKIIDRIGLIEGVAGTETIIVLRTVKEEIGIEL